MRSDVIRWAGISALLFAVALVVGFVVSAASGADLYNEDVAEMLASIDDGGGAFVFSSVWGMFAPILLLPLVLGLFYAHRDEDRPWAVLASTFLLVGAVLFILAQGVLVVLSGLGSDYVEASGATQTAILRDGDAFQTLFQLFNGIAFEGLAIGILITGILMLRATFFHRLLAGFSVLVGIVGLPVFLWFIFLPGVLIWLLAIGGTMWWKSREVAGSAPASA
ncbi:MAG: DUF4386 family protein [Chloroflexi bacterium]|nr:DUF4386 family protein [Chloroflexota bacterium]